MERRDNGQVVAAAHSEEALMRRSPMLFVALVNMVVLAGCGGGETASSIVVDSPSTTPSVITTEAPPTAATTTTAHAPSTTTTIVERAPSDDPADPAWVGVGFTAGAKFEWVDEAYHRIDTWVENPDALDNAGHWTVRLFVAGQPIDLWVWHRGSSYTGSNELLVVGAEPNPYMPGEYEQEIEGLIAGPPNSEALHHLGLWAIERDPGGRSVITDVAPLTRSGQNMGYAALVDVWRQYDLCAVDVSVTDDVYAYFDHEDPETEAFYTATLVYSVSTEGEIVPIDPDLVSCILAPDWEKRGY
jgi:hypothetical protein